MKRCNERNNLIFARFFFSFSFHFIAGAIFDYWPLLLHFYSQIVVLLYYVVVDVSALMYCHVGVKNNNNCW